MHDAIHTTATAPGIDIFDPRYYPRTYRVSTGSLIVYLLLGGLVFAGGVAGAWYFGTGHETKSADDAAMLVAVCLAFVALGGFLILYMLTTRVVLSADAIELRDFIRRRKLRRDDIAGRRVVDAHYYSTLVFVPKRAETKPLKIMSIMQTDFFFQAWFATLPDLDAQELEKSASEILASRDLGRTLEERVERLAAARKIAKGLTVVAVGVSIWGYFLLDPYEIVIAALAVLPLIAIALIGKFGRLYQLSGRTNDARANLVAVFIGPAIVLGLRAIEDIQLLNWTPMWAATVVGALVLTSVIAGFEREIRGRRWEVLAMLFLSSFYAYGGIIEANALLDRSRAQVFEASVLGKRTSGSKNTTYYLRLSPWGPRRAEDDVPVPSDMYEATAPGQRVCVILRSGALEMPWFVVTGCSGR
ncbi:MAG: hypothetical protein ACJ8LN_07655 [Sulfurifustis sp.]